MSLQVAEDNEDAGAIMKRAAFMAHAKALGVAYVQVGYFWNNDEGGIEYVRFENAQGGAVAPAQTRRQLWSTIEEMFYNEEVGYDYGRWTLNIRTGKWSFTHEHSTRVDDGDNYYSDEG